MPLLRKTLLFVVLAFCFPLHEIRAQTNLLLNGSFEDVNVCTEYESECGVEGWFYLRDVKAQMLAKYDSILPLGSNSFGIFYKWVGYTDFTPIIGAILPCRLQKGKQYIFRGLISAKLNSQLSLKPGIALGKKFYVPKRPFSATMQPDSIEQIHSLNQNNFYAFEYGFTATGEERYLTFGSYIHEDTVSGKHTFIGTQSISLVLDNFQLLPTNGDETVCSDFEKNKKKIYDYNFRHKEMDYSLYGKGELNIQFDDNDSNSITTIKLPEKRPAPADTLKLSDVFFDFNKANLKQGGLRMMEEYFSMKKSGIDSIYVEGHTDSIGSDDYNIELSRQRCESVKEWLLNNIATDASIKIHPFGRSRPVASNSTTEGRALNRRVEMIIFRRPAEYP